MSETPPSEQCPLVAVPFGLPKLTVAFGAHANAASRYGEGQSPASTPVASPVRYRVPLVDLAGYQRFVRERFEKDVAAAVLEQMLSVLEAARRFQRTERTVYRTLSGHRECPRCGGMRNRVMYTNRTLGMVYTRLECRICRHR